MIYLFEEYDVQPKELNSDDNVKNVKFVLPLRIWLFSPLPSIAVNIGVRYGVEFVIVDVKELEMKGKDWTHWRPHFMPVYIAKCTKENEIKSVIKNLKDAERELNAECDKIWRFFWRMKRI